jgi:hypothetical protein
MAVDEDQSFGSLTGLVDKLVLREVGGISHAVIIPHGNISFTRDGDHVRVKVDTHTTTHINYHIFQIDSQLGRLVDNGNLHAVTAHCQIDRLTGRTGTEETLYGLSAVLTRLFQELN